MKTAKELIGDILDHSSKADYASCQLADAVDQLQAQLTAMTQERDQWKEEADARGRNYFALREQWETKIKELENELAAIQTVRKDCTSPTLRDQFAMAVMSSGNVSAEQAYVYADQMMKVRDRFVIPG